MCLFPDVQRVLLHALSSAAGRSGVTSCAPAACLRVLHLLPVSRYLVGVSSAGTRVSLSVSPSVTAVEREARPELSADVCQSLDASIHSVSCLCVTELLNRLLHLSYEESARRRASWLLCRPHNVAVMWCVVQKQTVREVTRLCRVACSSSSSAELSPLLYRRAKRRLQDCSVRPADRLSCAPVDSASNAWHGR